MLHIICHYIFYFSIYQSKINEVRYCIFLSVAVIVPAGQNTVRYCLPYIAAYHNRVDTGFYMGSICT